MDRGLQNNHTKIFLDELTVPTTTIYTYNIYIYMNLSSQYYTSLFGIVYLDSLVVLNKPFFGRSFSEEKNVLVAFHTSDAVTANHSPVFFSSSFFISISHALIQDIWARKYLGGKRFI